MKHLLSTGHSGEHLQSRSEAELGFPLNLEAPDWLGQQQPCLKEKRKQKTGIARVRVQNGKGEVDYISESSKENPQTGK